MVKEGDSISASAKVCRRPVWRGLLFRRPGWTGEMPRTVDPVNEVLHMAAKEYKNTDRIKI